MTEAELNTGTALNAEIIDLTNKITAINSANFFLNYSINSSVGNGEYANITDDLTTKAALKTAILADLQATLDAKQLEFDNL